MLTLDELVTSGTQRMLDRPEVDEYCREQGVSVVSWLILYGHVVAARFLEQRITWDEASSAFNSIWPAVVSDDELTPFFFDLYCAFEDAELLETDAERTSFSRERLIGMRIVPLAARRNA